MRDLIDTTAKVARYVAINGVMSNPTTTITARDLKIGDVILAPITGVRLIVQTIEPPIGYPGRLDYRINGRMILDRNRPVVVEPRFVVGMPCNCPSPREPSADVGHLGETVVVGDLGAAS